MVITQLGTMLLMANYLIAFILLNKLSDGNAPEHRPITSLRTLVVGRVYFTVMLTIMAMTPIGGLFSFVKEIASAVHSLGAGYFILSLALDMVIAAMFARLEFYKAFAIVLANLPSIPFVTALACLVAWGEQAATIRRIRKDIETRNRKPTAVLGTVSKVVRLIEQTVRTGSDYFQVKTHIDIRKIPGKIEIRYAPTVEGREFNPHMIIVGESGTGKTTTLYSLVTQLMKHYPIILFDVKGDLTRSLYSDGFVDTGDAEIYMISQTGIDPFKPVLENETDTQMVEDLIDSVSILEEVGSKQAHFIRTARSEIRITGGTLTYENLLSRIEKLERDVIEGRIKYGPQTRDALEGIYDKLYDLKSVFRSTGASLASIYSPLLTGQPKLVVLNISDIPEKTRAIVLELMLRKLEKIMTQRGPLAFVEQTPIVTVIDEAYIVAKPIMLKGGASSGSRSILENIVRTGRSHGLALILATQRLSDIADGIRQSCYWWVILNTRSKEDMQILSLTAPRSVDEIIRNLRRGEAYIRILVPSRAQSLSSADGTRVIVEGYIFEMKRNELTLSSKQRKWEKTAFIKYCMICGRVLTTDGKCLGNHPQLLKEPVNVTNKEDEIKEVAADKEQNREAKSENRQSESLLDRAITALWLAIREAKDEEVAKTLEKIPYEVVIQYCRNWRNMKYGELFIKHGLLKIADGKPRITAAGKILLKTFKEVTANERQPITP
ncbi:MAG: DUF87 domain-containing protein [Candidatus Caldarchaeum sp.]